MNTRMEIMTASSSLWVRAVEKYLRPLARITLLNSAEQRVYQQNLVQQSGEPVLKEVKAHPTIHIYLVTMLTGDNLNRNVRDDYM